MKIMDVVVKTSGEVIESGNAAPKARNMIARGKRRAERDASPLDKKIIDREALKERNKSR